MMPFICQNNKVGDNGKSDENEQNLGLQPSFLSGIFDAEQQPCTWRYGNAQIFHLHPKKHFIQFKAGNFKPIRKSPNGNSNQCKNKPLQGPAQSVENKGGKKACC